MCGSSCRTADVGLTGATSARVDISGSDQGSADFAIPALPPENATAVFQAAQARMHALTSYADAEVFGPVEPDLQTQYQFEKPDRMHARASLGAEQVWVGSIIYRRDGPASVWVNDQQLVVRSEMRAQSHFMDDSYAQFDLNFGISAPA